MFKTIHIEHIKKIIKTTNIKHSEIIINGHGDVEQSGGTSADDDEEDYEEHMRVSPSNTDNAYKHWADTQTIGDSQIEMAGEIMRNINPDDDTIDTEEDGQQKQIMKN